ncbi:hypothetical protein HIM_01914 [Hirsutella minnesotensis 3608]|nr:hypothetical protein HIM_01914 [Hirsutella minnesotensis 3608]
MAMALEPVVVAPLTTHTHTVVFLHGRADNADNFAASFQHSVDSRNRTLFDAFPSFRWVFPRAPLLTCEAFPGQRIFQWFDIWSVSDLSLREELQAVGLRESVRRIRQLLHEEAALLVGHWDRLVLAGISQGAATATHTLLNLDLSGAAGERNGQLMPPRLGAYLGFSSRMPFPGRSLAETRAVLGLDSVPNDNNVLRGTPVLLEHCVNDPQVLVANGRALRETLTGFGAQVHWREYPDGGHWFNSPAGIDDAIQFLTRALGPSPSKQATGPVSESETLPGAP